MMTPAKIRTDSVVLVSGGARGITAQCVIELARQHRCRFILLGRSSIQATDIEISLREKEIVLSEPDANSAHLKRHILETMQADGEKPSPREVQKQYQSIVARREINATLAAIRAAGGDAKYVSADITDGQALQNGIADAIAPWGTVTGIIHGAGTLADKRIEHKTEADFEGVYRTKVVGLENLLCCVDPGKLDFLVLFSSFVGFYGNAGQADYAIANEVLNKSAHRLQRCYPRCRVVSMGWGPWDGGMVTTELKQHFQQLEMALISPVFGAQLLANEILQPPQPAAVQLTVMSRPITLSPAVDKADGVRPHQVRRQLSLAANPFVRDHVIGHQAVLPAMCGLSWIANAAEQRYPGYQFSEAKDFKVLKGIVFDETLAASHSLTLTQIQADESSVTVAAVVSSENKRGLSRSHYQTELLLRRRAIADSPTSAAVTAPLPSVTSTESPATPPAELYKDGTLFHQPGFQSIRTLTELTDQRLRCQCYLSSLTRPHQGQFLIQSLNPYTLDAFFQALLVWVRKRRDTGSLPAQFSSLKQIKPLLFNQPFEIVLEIVAEDDTTVTASATARTVTGEVCVQVEAMQVVKSDRLKQLFRENIYASTRAVAMV